jgi:hypothetical protein
MDVPLSQAHPYAFYKKGWLRLSEMCIQAERDCPAPEFARLYCEQYSPC